jgi:hypothetical protein
LLEVFLPLELQDLPEVLPKDEEEQRTGGAGHQQCKYLSSEIEKRESKWREGYGTVSDEFYPLFYLGYVEVNPL